MPRSHGRIMATIWNDPDFLALDEGSQRLYLFLLSQPDLSHAGLVPMRVKRWSKKFARGTVKTLEKRIDSLVAGDFIVVDEDTEELLVRTFVRNDGVYKQPKVMVRLREDAKQIESPRLRSAFKAELHRLPLDELSTSATGRGADGPSTREAVEGVVALLIQDFADASEWVSDTPSDTPRVRACAFPQPPTPSPLPPTTDPHPPRSDEPTERAARSETDDRFEEFWDTYEHKIGRKKAETAYRAALKKPGVTEDLLIASAASYIEWQKAEDKHPTYTKHAATWLHGEHWADERVGRPGRQTRVQEHLTLVERLAAEEAAQPRQIGDGR